MRVTKDTKSAAPSRLRFIGDLVRRRSLAKRSAQEDDTQTIGRSWGRRATKIHALAESSCRPLAFLLTGVQAADCTAGTLLLKRLPACRIALAATGYDSDAIRRQIEAARARAHYSA